MVGGITVTGGLWSFEFHAMFFYILAEIVLLSLIVISAAIFLKPRVVSPVRPHKPAAPRFVCID